MRLSPYNGLTSLTRIDAGRVLTGLACGAITATVPSYIAELSISSIRGILTGLFEVTYQTGSLVGFWINYGINENMNQGSTATWRIPMAVQIIPSAALLACGWLLHESPLWLFRNGKDDKALKALEELRQLPRDHQYIQEEVHTMRTRLEDEAIVASKYGTGAWAFFRGALFELSRKGMWNRVLLVFVAFALQNMSGAAGKSDFFRTMKNANEAKPSITTRRHSSGLSASRMLLFTLASTALSRLLHRSFSMAR